jgi:hypothetical protein
VCIETEASCVQHTFYLYNIYTKLIDDLPPIAHTDSTRPPILTLILGRVRVQNANANATAEILK